MLKHKLSVDEILANIYMNGETPKESDKELLPVYDENENILGYAPRLLCHRLGLIHKVAYLLIGDNSGRILLQTRGDGRLDMAVGGHVSYSDSSVFVALARESKEELCLTITQSDVEKVCTYRKEYEFKPKKPEDFNREIRELYYLKVNPEQSEKMTTDFGRRMEQENVKAIKWFEIDEVVKLCQEGKAAEGVKSSLSYYLHYLKGKKI